MKKYLIILTLLSACELIVIGEKQVKDEIIRIDRSSAVGSVMLFKTELDSNNIPAAADILANPNGNKFLAVERVEYYDELYRMRNIIGKRPITWIKDDTLSSKERRLEIEFGYLKKFRFTTSKIDSNWYILNWEMI